MTEQIESFVKVGDVVKFIRKGYYISHRPLADLLTFTIGDDYVVADVCSLNCCFSTTEYPKLWAPIACVVRVEEAKEAKSSNEVKGVKFDEGKLRFDLLPAHALEEVAAIYTYGANKYEPWNWAKGLAWSRVFAALMRHLWAWARGEDRDPESKMRHLAHAAWGCLTLLELSRMDSGEDDRWKT